MNVYLLTQKEVLGWDTYDSAVVIAESSIIAARMHPSDGVVMSDNEFKNVSRVSTWATHPSQVGVELIGVSSQSGRRVVCASFNAG